MAVKFNILYAFAYFLALVAPYQVATAESEAFASSPGICEYKYDGQSRYTCELHNAVITSPDQVLEITGNHIFEQTNANVQVVVLKNATINFLNSEILDRFVNLKVLNVQNVQLTSIAAHAFTNCSQLDELDVSGNKLTSLSDQLLRNCRNLRTLRASKNSIFSLPNELFGTNKNLEIFEMDNNQLGSFPTNLLTNMERLKIFNVQRNLLSSLNIANFQNNSNLDVLDVSYNRLSSLFNLISTQINLKVLKINNNVYNIGLNFAILVRFPNLQELAVDANQGTQSVLFNSLPASLTRLEVTGINFQPPNFDRVPNLVHLRIGGSGIYIMQPSLFQALTKLESLEILNTQINALDPHLFNGLTGLRSLVISGSYATTQLPAGIFAPLTNLEEFTLTATGITTLGSNAFEQHSKLRKIDFSKNYIHAIQRGLFSKFATDLLTADFRENNCIDQSFAAPRNLDQNDAFQRCFENYDFSNPTETPGDTTTSTDGSGNNFKKIEILGVLLIGFFGMLWNLLK